MTLHFKLKLLAILILCAISLANQKIHAQKLTGKILNETNEPVPYSTVYVPDTKEGTVSNDNGDFKLSVPRGRHTIIIRSLGFRTIQKEIEVNADSLFLPVVLQKQNFELKEVKVFSGTEDPALFIMRKAIAQAPFYRRKIKHYEAQLYIKSNFSFTNIPKIYQNRIVVNNQKLKDVFKENIIYIIESNNLITYDFPDHYDQKVLSKKTSLTGFDEPPVMGLMTSSFYEDRPNEIISPLSSMALKHYDFQYDGFITIGDNDIFKINVLPKRKSDELVSGNIYIVDKLWCIYSLDFNSKLEFFRYRIKQQFENLGNNNWLPVSHVINGNLSMLGLKGMFYYGAALKYNSIKENTPENQGTLHKTATNSKKATPPPEKRLRLQNKLEKIVSKNELTNADVKKTARINRKILKEQYKDSSIIVNTEAKYNLEDLKDSVKTHRTNWDTIRMIPLTAAEVQSYQYSDSLRTMRKASPDSLVPQNKKGGNSLFAKIIKGHYDLINDSSVNLQYSGLISLQNSGYNAVDGFYYFQKASVIFKTDSAKNISFSPEVGYAFNRKTWFWSSKIQLTNLVFKKSILNIDAGKKSFDFKKDGITPLVNSISSLFFANNIMRLYESGYVKLHYQKQVNKKISIGAGINYNHFYPLKNHAFYFFSDKKAYAPNLPKGYDVNNPYLGQQTSFGYKISGSYYKLLEKPWLTRSPFLFISDLYRIQVSYARGFPNIMSSVSDYSHLHTSIIYEANISPTSGIGLRVNAGHFFRNNQMHFSQFYHLNTSYIPVSMKNIPHTFHTLNDYQFSTNQSYINASAEFRSEYILLRYWSLINKQTWSESLHFNFVEMPALHHYWEGGYSINNLFFLGKIAVFAGFNGSKFNSARLIISLAPLN